MPMAVEPVAAAAAAAALVAAVLAAPPVPVWVPATEVA